MEFKGRQYANQEYFHPMDRGYTPQDIPPPANIEDPIFPISQVGTTVVERDPTGRNKNIVQSVQASIRSGAGTLQLVMNVPPDSALGGRPKAYGKEVREALREVTRAAGVNMGG